MGSLDENIGTDFEMADEAWDQLAGWLEQFASAWKDQGQPPELSGFAPSEPAEIRRLTLVELVKLDMEYRVEADHPRRLIEEYFPDRVERQPGESQASYDRRMDKFATHRLPSVLRTAREDQKPWLISFVGAVDFLEREFEQDPELWRHVIKVENSEKGDHIVIPEIGDFQERLRLIHQKFDELQGKK